MVGFVATLPIKLPFYLGIAIGEMIKKIREVHWVGVFTGILTAASNIFKGVMDAGLRAWNFLRNLDWGAILSAIGRGIANAVIGLIEGAINGALAGVAGMKKFNLPRFEQGGWVPQTGLAVVHAGEYVLSRDMLAGKQPIQAPITNTSNKNITIGPVYVSNQMDAESMIRQISFALKFDSSI